jgi:hypothetical protein
MRKSISGDKTEKGSDRRPKQKEVNKSGKESETTYHEPNQNEKMDGGITLQKNTNRRYPVDKIPLYTIDTIAESEILNESLPPRWV